MDSYDCYLSLKEWEATLMPLLTSKEARIAIIGCGHAPFSVELARRGYKNIVNMDYSPTVIALQKKRFPAQRWEVGDVRQLQFEDGSIDIIIDKACADSLLECRDSGLDLSRMFRECSRVVRPGGKCVVLTKWFERADDGMARSTRKEYGEGVPTLAKYTHLFSDEACVTVDHRLKRPHRTERYNTLVLSLPRA